MSAANPHPSDIARARARLQNKLKNAGITVELNTSDETLEALKREAEQLQAEAEREESSGSEKHSGARYRAIRATVLQALHRIQTDREKSGTDSDDPEAVEAKALEFLRHRGWRCDRVDIVPVVIRALEGHPEAREAVVAALGRGGGR